MSNGLKHFRRLSVTKNTTTLIHPNGHKIELAHEHLSPKLRGQIEALPHMSEGGAVHMANAGVVPEDSPTDNWTQGDIRNTGTEPAPFQIDATARKPITAEDIPSMLEQKQAELSHLRQQNYSHVPDEQLQQQAEDNARAAYSRMNQPETNPADILKNPEKFSQWDLANAKAQQTAQDFQAHSTVPMDFAQAQGSAIQPVSAPQEAPPQTGINPMSGKADQNTVNLINQNTGLPGIGKELGAIQGAAGVESELARKNSQILQQQQWANQVNLQRQQDVMSDYQQESQHLIDDIKNDRVNPNQFWENKSLPSKISTGIGLILGGIGGGMTGQENPALKLLQNHIEQNIEAQRFNIGNKKSLLNAMRAKYGDDISALNATRLLTGEIVNNQLQTEAAKSNDPLIKFRAQQAEAQLGKAALPYMMQLQAMQALKGGDTDRYMQTLKVADPASYERMQKSYLPGIGFAKIDVPDKVRENLTERAGLNAAVTDLANFSNQHRGSLSPSIMAQGSAKASLVVDRLRRVNGEGVFRAGEAQFLNKIVNQNPTGFLQQINAEPRYKALLDDNNAQLSNIYGAYGINKQPGGGSGPPTTSQRFKAVSFKPMSH